MRDYLSNKFLQIVVLAFILAFAIIGLKAVFGNFLFLVIIGVLGYFGYRFWNRKRL